MIGITAGALRRPYANEIPMKMRRTNYDEIAERYDEDRKSRTHEPHRFIRRALDEGAKDLAALDLGCGPGRWLAAQIAHFNGRPVRWVGLDPFAGMLALARRNAPGAELVQGGAEAIPFPDVSFDLVVSITSFHHFEDKERALDEVVRVLRPGGYFEIGNIAPWSMRGWWSYRFFPESWDMDAAKHWPVERLLEGLRRRGLAAAAPSINPWRVKTKIANVLAQAERRTLSQLASLDDPAYARGLERIKELVAENPSGTVEDEGAFYGLVARKSSTR